MPRSPDRFLLGRGFRVTRELGFAGRVGGASEVRVAAACAALDFFVEGLFSGVPA